MKRKLALIALVLSVMMLLAACAPKAPEATATPAPVATEAPATEVPATEAPAATEAAAAVEEAATEAVEKVEEVATEAAAAVEGAATEVAAAAGAAVEAGKEAVEGAVEEAKEAVAAAVVTLAPDAKAVNLNMAITASETSSWYAGAEAFKKDIEEKTGGRYTVTLFANEQLAGGDQQRGVEMIYTGESQADLHSTMIHSNIEPKLAAISMPFAFKTLEEVDSKLINNEAAVAEVRKLVEAKGPVLLGIGENGFRQITNSKHTIKTPEDLKNLKIRVPNIALNLDVFKALGADPTAMAFGEVYTALQQGTIDGQENPLDTIHSNNIQEVQKYISLWNYSYDPILLTVSRDLWDSLSEEDKVIFQEAGAAAMEMQRAETRERNVALEKTFADAGMEVYSLTDAEKQAFKDKLTDLVKTYEEKLGKDLLTAMGYYE